MKKSILSLALVVMSLPAVAQYACQISNSYCGNSYGLSTVQLNGYCSDYNSALTQCQNIARQYNSQLCQVVNNGYNNGGSYPQPYGSAYYCQLTTGYCGLNGGRYTLQIQALNYQDALNKCQTLGYQRNDSVCQVSVSPYSNGDYDGNNDGHYYPPYNSGYNYPYNPPIYPGPHYNPPPYRDGDGDYDNDGYNHGGGYNNGGGYYPGNGGGPIVPGPHYNPPGGGYDNGGGGGRPVYPGPHYNPPGGGGGGPIRPGGRH